MPRPAGHRPGRRGRPAAYRSVPPHLVPELDLILSELPEVDAPRLLNAEDDPGQSGDPGRSTTRSHVIRHRQ